MNMRTLVASACVLLSVPLAVAGEPKPPWLRVGRLHERGVVEGRRARGMKEIQIFRNEIQARWNEFQIRRNEIQIQMPQFLRRIELFQGLTPTPTAVFLFEADSGCKCRGKAGVCSPGVVHRSFRLRFRFLRLFQQGTKGWRLFMIADAWARFRPTCRPRSLKSAKKGTRGPKCGSPGS